MEINKEIILPTELQNIWSGLQNWKFEISFSLQGNRCVYRELYEDYSDVKVLSDVLSKLTDGADDSLPIYRFYSEKTVPLFRTFADGKLFSRSSPRKFVDRGAIQGRLPWEQKSDDTIFSLGRYQKNKYYGEPYIRLRCGGISKTDALTNWKHLRAIIV